MGSKEKDTALSKFLRQSAVDNGLCDEWRNAWNDDCTQQELINKYLRGIDFCLQHRWPSVDFINNHFDKALLRKNGILASDNYSLVNKPIIVALGYTASNIRISGDNPSRIYLNDNSVVTIIIKTHEKVIIECRDRVRCKVFADAAYNPDALVISYSDEAIVEAPECVRFKKESKDYLHE